MQERDRLGAVNALFASMHRRAICSSVWLNTRESIVCICYIEREIYCTIDLLDAQPILAIGLAVYKSHFVCYRSLQMDSFLMKIFFGAWGLWMRSHTSFHFKHFHYWKHLVLCPMVHAYRMLIRVANCLPPIFMSYSKWKITCQYFTFMKSKSLFVYKLYWRQFWNTNISELFLRRHTIIISSRCSVAANFEPSPDL